MDLFNILSHDERIIVLSNEGDSVIYTWNRSLTLQCWQRVPSFGRRDEWKEISVRTLSEEPRNFNEASTAALKWQYDGKEESHETPEPRRSRRAKASR